MKLSVIKYKNIVYNTVSRLLNFNNTDELKKIFNFNESIKKLIINIKKNN